MENDVTCAVTAFKNTFSKAAKKAITDKEFMLDYCINNRAWKGAVIRERFNKESKIIKNRAAISKILKDELVGNVDAICKNFDEWHANLCNRTDYGMRYGVWQKFVNMLFKNLYCVKELFPEYERIWDKCHCPIDTRIAKILYEQLKVRGLSKDELELSRKISKSTGITWNSIDEENYKLFQNQIMMICKQENLTLLQFDFKYWK